MTTPSESPFEVRPVRFITEGAVVSRALVFLIEVCNPSDATMWSVYERDAEGLPQWLADCGTEADARRIVAALVDAANTRALSDAVRLQLKDAE